MRCPSAIAVLATSLTLAAAAPSPADADEQAPTGRVRELLLSRQAAEAHGLAVGDVVTLAAYRVGGPTRPFRVAGIYEPTPDPMRLTAEHHRARLHLPDLLELAADPADPDSLETVGTINVALVDPDDAEVFARDLAAAMPGLGALPTAPPRDGSNPFVVIERFHLAIAVVTVIGSAAFLLALMVMRADERRETVGILRLIGFSRKRVLLEVFFEGLLIAAVGAILGVLLAVAIQEPFNRFFQWRYDTSLIFVRVTAPIALRSAAFAIPLGVVAGLAAAWVVLRRDVLALLRR